MADMFFYTHNVQYYETDKMGVTHHSNYIRWMEEARIALLDSIDLGYDRMEAAGIVSPVTGVSCEYKHPTTFKDAVKIGVRAVSYDGVKLVMGYEMVRESTGQVALTGTTTHLFLNEKGAFLRMKRDFPLIDAAIRHLVEEGAEN